MVAGARAKLALAASFALTLSAQAPASDPAPRLDLILRPVASGDAVSHVEIAMVLTGLRTEASAPLVRLPLVVNNVDTVAAELDVTARDASGTLALTARVDGEGAAAARVWTADRTTEGPVTLRYRVPIGARTATRGAAPPLELRSESGAFSGAGSTFLVLPPNAPPSRLSVRWDLGAMREGAVGASSLGPGNATSAAPQPVSRLERSFFMAGAIGHYEAGRFFAAWQGAPPFDAPALMAWTGRLHVRFVDIFRPPEPSPYGVFLRHNPVNAGGGVGLADSFVATFGPGTDGDDLKLTLAHEMFHTFAPSIGNPAGLESSWFGEGLAVFYARALTLRLGEITPERFLENLNSTAARYYTSAMMTAPNSEVPRRFWADTRIRTLPYDRGALYFSVVDDRMRKRWRGRRSLDDLLRAMLERQRSGRTLANADWEEVLHAQLGPAAVAEFRAMLAGTPPLPESDAFGPCFRRTQRPLRRYVLGFEPAVLTEPRRIVRGLIAGSAAEAAGLRNGDEILRPVPQDGIQGNQTQLLRLEIRRDGRDFPLSYLPRGETVQAWQWERVANVPASRCAL